MRALVAAVAPFSGHLQQPAIKKHLTTQLKPTRSTRPATHRRPLCRLRLSICRSQRNNLDFNVGGGGGGVDDDVLEDLLNKYGEVVYQGGDVKKPGEEADDDAESLSFAVTVAKVANDVKAADIRVLFVKPLVYWTRFFIIATAFSRPQIDAIGSRIRDIAEKQFTRTATGDTKPNSWTLLDFGDVVVHIFLPPQRAFYNLEEFYGNATLIELPFDNSFSGQN